MADGFFGLMRPYGVRRSSATSSGMRQNQAGKDTARHTAESISGSSTCVRCAAESISGSLKHVGTHTRSGFSSACTCHFHFLSLKHAGTHTRSVFSSACTCHFHICSCSGSSSGLTSRHFAACNGLCSDEPIPVKPRTRRPAGLIRLVL